MAGWCLRGNGRGGGVAIGAWTNVQIQSCTIVSNQANVGGGIRFTTSGVTGAVVNTIVYSNNPSDLGVAAGQTNYFTNCCSATVLPAANGNITTNPRFVNWAAGNYRLSFGSLCREAGTNQPWMDGNVDLSGQARVRYDCVDIGAYEWFPNLKVNGIPAGKWKYINGKIPRSVNGVPVP